MAISPYRTYETNKQPLKDEYDDRFEGYIQMNNFLSKRIIYLEFEREVMFNFILACELEEELEKFREGYLIGLEKYSH